MLITSTYDKSIYIWNWEAEALITVIKIENIAIKILSGSFPTNKYLLTLLDSGAV
jgi:hypothetical protein